MTRFSTRAFIPLLILLAIGLTGCQESLVQPTPEPLDPDAPMSQAEFDKQLAKNGVVVLQPKDYEAFGGPLETDSEALKSTCVDRSSRSTTYSVCSNSEEIVIDNADFFRVTIDATIFSPPEFVCDGPSRISCTYVREFVSVTSSTVRNDGVVLQNNEYDGNLTAATTDFVAVYPQADTFTFNHTSDFATVNDTISVQVSP